MALTVSCSLADSSLVWAASCSAVSARCDISCNAREDASLPCATVVSASSSRRCMASSVSCSPLALSSASSRPALAASTLSFSSARESRVAALTDRSLSRAASASATSSLDRLRMPSTFCRMVSSSSCTLRLADSAFSERRRISSNAFSAFSISSRFAFSSFSARSCMADSVSCSFPAHLSHPTLLSFLLSPLSRNSLRLFHSSRLHSHSSSLHSPDSSLNRLWLSSPSALCRRSDSSEALVCSSSCPASIHALPTPPTLSVIFLALSAASLSLSASVTLTRSASNASRCRAASFCLAPAAAFSESRRDSVCRARSCASLISSFRRRRSSAHEAAAACNQHDTDTRTQAYDNHATKHTKTTTRACCVV
mmetsp:Transcript_31625/g.68358  ORF Transcript_31625/g.68358 Transcript_31625/m.68358 type:complete len:368 (-) Transcript_31625:443-1546(-)